MRNAVYFCDTANQAVGDQSGLTRCAPILVNRKVRVEAVRRIGMRISRIETELTETSSR